MNEFNRRVAQLGGSYQGKPTPTGAVGNPHVADLNRKITTGPSPRPMGSDKPIPQFSGRGGVVQVEPEYYRETKAFLASLPEDDIVHGGLVPQK